MKRTADEILFNALMTGSVSEAVDMQEAAGSKDLLCNDVLPIKGTLTPGVRSVDISKIKTELESIGFLFGEMEDDIFVKVKLPDGWYKESQSNYWSYLFDDKGRCRASIFYKAAFYDRSAHINWIGRYSTVVLTHDNLKLYYDEALKRADAGTLKIKGCIVDGYDGHKETFNIVWETDVCAVQPKDYDTEQLLEIDSADQLSGLYPEFKNPFAYWGE